MDASAPVYAGRQAGRQASYIYIYNACREGRREVGRWVDIYVHTH